MNLIYISKRGFAGKIVKVGGNEKKSRQKMSKVRLAVHAGMVCHRLSMILINPRLACSIFYNGKFP